MVTGGGYRSIGPRRPDSAYEFGNHRDSCRLSDTSWSKRTVRGPPYIGRPPAIAEDSSALTGREQKSIGTLTG